MERAQDIAARIKGDTLWQYKTIEGWWGEEVFAESYGPHRRGLTPIELVETQVNDLGEFEGLSFLTPNLEYVPFLVNGGARSVTLVSKHECEKTRNVVSSKVFGLEAEYLVNPKLEATMPKKYDIAIGNPPYRGQAKLHQKFFNMAVNMVEDGGKVSFIQPATAYFNKKAVTDPPSQKMRENIKKYKTEVKIIPPSIFGNVSIRGDLAVTKLVKVETPDSTIDKVEYISGKVVKNVDLENVTKTEMDPHMFASIKKKYEAYVEKNGSIIERQSLDKTALMARLPARMTEDPVSWPIFFIEGTRGTRGAHGILASSKKEVDRIYEYLMTNPARFGLAILMFSTDLKGGGSRFSPSRGLQPCMDR